MTRNDSAPDSATHRRQREAMNWPTALVLVVLLVAGVAVAWICAGAATDIWGS